RRPGIPLAASPRRPAASSTCSPRAGGAAPSSCWRARRGARPAWSARSPPPATRSPATGSSTRSSTRRTPPASSASPATRGGSSRTSSAPRCPALVYLHPRELAPVRHALPLGPRERFIQEVGLAGMPRKLDRLLALLPWVPIRDAYATELAAAPPAAL